MGDTLTTDGAILLPYNGAIRNAVAGDPNGIGYISRGYVDSGVRALAIDGVSCTPENCQVGKYPLSRPLYFLTSGEATGVAAEFINFSLSDVGQTIVADEGYIRQEGKPWNPPQELTGNILEAGSTTIQPLAEKLVAKFVELYPEVSIDILGGGSSMGIKSVGNGTVDMGATSRELKSSELEEYPELKTYIIAYDAVAIIVHPDNPVHNLTIGEVARIFGGGIADWKELEFVELR
jgi:phosphate transport system substrate-binding protein